LHRDQERQDVLDRYPNVDALRLPARRRLPHFAWEHLESGTGREEALVRNRRMLDRIRMTPRLATRKTNPDLSTELFGQRFEVPFGIAPVGTTGMFWPGGEQALARSAKDYAMPYILSCVACESIEAIGAIAGKNAWLQLYPPHDKDIRDDLIARAAKAGFGALVLTLDVPVYGTRDRQRRAGLGATRPGFNLMQQYVLRPAWTLATLRHGSPRFSTIARYADNDYQAAATRFVMDGLNAPVDAGYLREIRALWAGPMIIKGVLNSDDAQWAVDNGADGLIVSNHGARQFDGAPAPVEVLEGIVERVGARSTVMVDSGMRTGLDVTRALSLGARFVFFGRAFIYGIAALGPAGAGHVAEILKRDLDNNMRQLGAGTVSELGDADIPAIDERNTFEG
jgi:L-lactate dehydrogenase (cytochrome)